MTISAVSSSPRHHSNSASLLARALEAAKDLGATISRYDVAVLDIGPCTACEACQPSAELPCVFGDDAIEILASMRQSDAIVFAGPIYNFAVAAQLKLLLDRMYSLGGNGRWEALVGKKLGAILTYGDDHRESSGVENAAGMFRDIAAFHRMPLAGIVEASCDKAGEVMSNHAAMSAAADLGRRLAE